MKRLLKVLLLPVWLPLAILWFVAKLLAFVIVLVIAGILIVHFI